jgi:hypothetical protein
MEYSIHSMNKFIISYAIIAIAAATTGLTALATNGNSFTLTYAQINQTQTAQYCAEGDYECHEKYAVEDSKAGNLTGAIYHYELAAENAPYGELPKHYEQAASALKYNNVTDAEMHHEEANAVGEQ